MKLPFDFTKSPPREPLIRTWLQRTDYSQMNLPDSDSDSAKEMTKPLACDDCAEA